MIRSASLGLLTLMMVAACDRSKPNTPTEAPEIKAAPATTKAPETKAAVKTPEAKAPEAPKDCVKDYKADGAKRLEEPADSLMYDEIKDLDGDGTKERLVFYPSASNASYAMYLSRKGCWGYAGQYNGMGFDILKTSTLGHKDFDIWLKDGCAGLAGVHTSYRWDGKAYKATKTVDCPCPLDPVAKKGAKRDPVCPSDE